MDITNSNTENVVNDIINLVPNLEGQLKDRVDSLIKIIEPLDFPERTAVIYNFKNSSVYIPMCLERLAPVNASMYYTVKRIESVTDSTDGFKVAYFGNY